MILSRCLPVLSANQAAIRFDDVPDRAKEDIDRLSSAGLVEGYGNGILGAGYVLTVEQVRILITRLAEQGSPEVTEGGISWCSSPATFTAAWTPISAM